MGKGLNYRTGASFLHVSLWTFFDALGVLLDGCRGHGPLGSQ